MKLWLISQGDNNGYDTYDSAVVAAETEREAKETHPGQEFWKDGSWWYKMMDGTDRKDSFYGTWASSPDRVDAEYLGEAKDGTEAGVVCASFNAG